MQRVPDTSPKQLAFFKPKLTRRLETRNSPQPNRRPPFASVIQEPTIDSPLEIIERLYNQSKTPAEREACLRYVLHYQHYNAEFTQDENKHLHYLDPLCAPQKTSGYVRIEQTRLMDLFWPWIEKNLKDFLRKAFKTENKKKIRMIKPGASSTLAVLGQYFSKTHKINELTSFDEEKQDPKTSIWVIRIKPSDLKKDLQTLFQEHKFNINKIIGTHKFIFILSITDDIDCSLYWGAEVELKNKIVKANYLSLEELFEPNITKVIQEPNLPTKFSMEFETFSKRNKLVLTPFQNLARTNAKLADFFSSSHRLIELDALGELETSHKATLIFLPLAETDLAADLTEIVSKKIARNDLLKALQEQDFFFLFTFQDKGGAFFWGARWKAQKGDLGPILESASINWVFSQDVFSILNRCGAMPDRLAINQFIATHLNFLDLRAFLHPINKPAILEEKKQDGNNVIDSTSIWRQHIIAINEYRFNTDSGSELYRDIIIRWTEILLRDNETLLNFAAPLLCSQVIPYCQPGYTIIQWQKAYQNFCEILMLCFEYFPAMFPVNYDQTVVDILDPKNSLRSSNVTVLSGIYSYAMSGVYDILCQQILTRSEYQQRAPSIACNSQSYFETLTIINDVYCQNKAEIQQKHALAEIKGEPDILIAEIHPNNAAHSEQVTQDVAGWIYKQLEKNPLKHMILVLDVTINYLSDPEIQNLLSQLERFILNKQLEIYGIQSLAKLTQLGADNFSGGGCFYLGIPPQGLHPKFPSILPQKAIFFGFLLKNFQSLIARYFEKVRQNTHWLHNTLFQKLSNVSKSSTIQMGNEVRNFCPIEISFNIDSGTVYVALSFAPFFKLFDLSAKQKENYIKKFQKILLELAKLRGLPITGRQSFGFSLSNMCTTSNSIRFSIGVEPIVFLEQYGELIEDFSYALSLYAQRTPKDFDIDFFSNTLRQIHDQVQKGKSNKYEVILLDSEDTPEIIGNADIYLNNHLLYVDMRRESKNDDANITIPESHLRPGDLTKTQKNKYWNYKFIFYLFTRLSFDRSAIKVYEFDRSIRGFLTEGITTPIHTGTLIDEESHLTIDFDPFKVTDNTDGKVYSSEQVFVRTLLYQSMSVNRSKLKKGVRKEVFTLLAQSYVKPEKHPHGILLIPSARRPFMDYKARIDQLFDEGGMVRVAQFLNRELPEKLPLVHDHDWTEYSPSPEERIAEVLITLGQKLAETLTAKDINAIHDIRAPNFKKVIIQGIFYGLLHISMQKIEAGAAEEKESIDESLVEKLFSTPDSQEFIRDLDREFDDWIYNLYQALNENSQAIIAIYLKCLTPIIKVFYSTPESLGRNTSYANILHYLVITVDNAELKNHLYALEIQIPAMALQYQTTDALYFFLDLYLHYPLTEKTQVNLLTVLELYPNEILLKWFINYDDTLVVISEEDHARFDYFISSTNILISLSNALKSDPNQYVDTAIRFAIDSQNKILAEEILVIFQQRRVEKGVCISGLRLLEANINDPSIKQIINSMLEEIIHSRAPSTPKVQEPIFRPIKPAFFPQRQKEIPREVSVQLDVDVKGCVSVKLALRGHFK